MIYFIIRRLAVSIPTLLILIILSFILMYSAPGGPFTSERPLPPQVLANIQAKYGLDDPLWKQIWDYTYGIIFNFDFGPSFRYKDRSVNDKGFVEQNEDHEIDLENLFSGMEE